MSKVLLTNGLLSKTLAAVRSLGSRGVQTIIAEKTRWHTSGFSKYCSKSLLCPDPSASPELYKDWLIDAIRRENCDVLFIMDDDTMKAAMEYRAELETVCRAPMPPKEGYEIAADKGRTMELAASLGVPCPKTVQYQGTGTPSTEQLTEIVQLLQYPIVIKPRHSSGSRGIRIAENLDDLIRTFYQVHADYPNPIIQEFIPRGSKYDVCLCYDAKRNVKASYVQKQIRNFPLERGPSTVHESVAAPLLVEYSKLLMDSLGWFGVADIEYMIDPRNGQPKLMEINPRFWSSLHLSIRCGVDFPWMLYQLALGNDIDSIDNYVTGKYGRAILPGDILHFVSNPNRWRMDPPFFTTRFPDDTMSLHDPMPTVGFFLSALRYSLDAKTWRFLIRR